MSVKEEAQDAFSNLPAIRWRVFQRRFDAPMDELVEDKALMLIILAHEYNRTLNGNKDEWERFEQMSLPNLNKFLGLSGDDAEPKSDSDNE
jgi:hypothetical protein